MARGDDRRWPRRLYATGTEPDPRFTLANERTFLAWLRTALGLMAAGVGVAVLLPGHGSLLRITLALFLEMLGAVCGLTAFTRWLRVERALRQQKPLPSTGMIPVMGYTIGLAGLAGCSVIVAAVIQ
nr:DUF202 domain-containing protein [Kibdelosporangium sp. MJ126-NF4]CEL18116.1 Inner membrane protein [Kibdelosporangium sp. MJ126-NF4]